MVSKVYVFIIVAWFWVCFVAAIVFGPESETAFILGYPGTGLIMLAWVIFVGFHSRKRWPEKSFIDRLGMIFTFQR